MAAADAAAPWQTLPGTALQARLQMPGGGGTLRFKSTTSVPLELALRNASSFPATGPVVVTAEIRSGGVMVAPVPLVVTPPTTRGDVLAPGAVQIWQIQWSRRLPWGAQVPPGEYEVEVRVSAGTSEWTQRFTVRLDP